MGSLVFLGLSLGLIGLTAWGLELFRQTRVVAVLMVVIPVAALIYDNGIIVVGRFVGAGTLLEWLSWPRFVGHTLFTPVWVIAAGSLARVAGFSWARSRWGMGAFCLLATGLIGYGFFWLTWLDLQPVCWLDTVRYSATVHAEQVCFADQALVSSGGPPVVPIVMVLVVLLVGIPIGLRARWPWMVVGAVQMLVLAGLPQGQVGPAPGALGEVLMSLAMLATAVHLIRRSVPIANGAGIPMNVME